MLWCDATTRLRSAQTCPLPDAWHFIFLKKHALVLGCRYVLLKERNMLATLKLDAKAKGLRAANPSRARKVRRSMARIKHVLWERKLAEDAEAMSQGAAEILADEDEDAAAAIRADTKN